jgi:hypothetical protein
MKKNDQKNKDFKKDTSGFGGKPYLRREEFREWLRRPEQFSILKSPSHERAKLEKELFGREYGYYIEKKEAEKVLKKLEREKFKAFTSLEKAKVEKKIRLMKKFLGK